MERNVVLLVLDSVRKDFFDEYASRLQQISDVSFEQCRAASSWSPPSHASMMTGRLPHQHEVHSANRDFTSYTKEDTFLAELPNHKAFGASANIYASSAYGFDGLFDEFVDINPHRRFSTGADMRRMAHQLEKTGTGRYFEFLRNLVQKEKTLPTLANVAYSQIKSFQEKLPVPNVIGDGGKLVSQRLNKFVSRREEPMFLFANFMDAHSPLYHVRGYDSELHSAPVTWNSNDHIDFWEINEDGEVDKYQNEIEMHRELYGAAIDYLDKIIVELIEDLREKTGRETTIIITSDHGQNMGYEEDQQLYLHFNSLTESSLHVPFLIINPPEGYSSTESGYFSQVRLGELITGLATGQTPDVFDDQIVAERIGSWTTSPTNAPVSADRFKYWDRMLRCVYEGETKTVWDSLGNITEYEINQEKPCWEREIEAIETVPSAESDRFDQGIVEYKSSQEDSDERDLDMSTEKRLEELGYI